MIDVTVERPLPPLIVKAGDPDAYEMDVYFNGQLSHAFSYVNQIKGYGKRYKTHPDGSYVRKDSEFAVEKVYGKLEIRWRDD